MLSIGEELHGRYKIEALLGEGGMGAVYRASDWLEDGRLCAIKEFRLGQLPSKSELDEKSIDATHLHSNPLPLSREQALEQFRREAKLLKQLHHPNLPEVYDYFTLGSEAYIVMTLVEGQDLVEVIKANDDRPLEEDVIRSILEQILSALRYCHEHHVIHRDIKPDNILLSKDGNAYLVDFGIAKDTSQSTNTTTIAARAQTPGYAPPEQGGFSRTDERSDIYSLGATIYFLCTGQIPVHASDRSAGIDLPQIKNINHQISSSLVGLVEKSMKLDRNERFQSVTELQNYLLHSVEIHGGEHRPDLFFPIAPPITNITGTQKPKLLQNIRIWLGLSTLVIFILIGIFIFPRILLSSRSSLVEKSTAIVTPLLTSQKTIYNTDVVNTSTPIQYLISTSVPLSTNTPPYPTITNSPVLSATPFVTDSPSATASSEPTVDTLAINSENITQLVAVVGMGIGGVNDIAFSPDSKILAISTVDKIILATGTLFDQHSEYPAFSSQIGFSYDGKYLVTYEGNQIKYRDIKTMNVASVCKIDPAELKKMAIFPNRDWVAATSQYLDPYIAICTSSSSQPVRYLNGIDSFGALAVSPVSDSLASAINNTIVVWPGYREIITRTSEVLQYTNERIISLVFSETGGEIFDSTESGMIEKWSIQNKASNLQQAWGFESKDLAIIPNTDILISATYGQVLFLSTGSLKELFRIEGHQNLQGPLPYFTSIAVSPDAQTIAAASDDSFLYIIKLSSTSP